MPNGKTQLFGLLTFRPHIDDFNMHSLAIEATYKNNSLFTPYAGKFLSVKEGDSHFHTAIYLKEEWVDRNMASFRDNFIAEFKENLNSHLYEKTDWKVALRMDWGKPEKGDSWIKALAYCLKESTPCNSFNISEDEITEAKKISNSTKKKEHIPAPYIICTSEKYAYFAYQCILIYAANTKRKPAPELIMNDLAHKGFIFNGNKQNILHCVEQLITYAFGGAGKPANPLIFKELLEGDISSEIDDEF